ncbi:MAG TPA: transketolase [Ruminococcaceae bacterium]|jgi:transketolase|nr:transketolase [Oscillospiraceae bacterium]
MTKEEKKELQVAACKIRKGVIEGVHAAKSGHPGGALSSAEIFAYLYFKELRVDPANPKDADRDRFVLSKGHACPGLYAALALKGYFPWDELKKLRHIGAMLQGHPDMKGTPGVDMSTGSLGQGVSAACGMALAGKLDGKGYRVYSLLGDGELEEGEVWEASMFAGHHKLDNLCLIVDNNGLQIDGPVSEVGGPEPIDEKFKAFGFDVQKINGNSLDDIEKSIEHAKTVKGKPSVIIASTVKGKGVSYMENQVGWHGKAPNDEQYETAMCELNKQLSELEAE